MLCALFLSPFVPGTLVRTSFNQKSAYPFQCMCMHMSINCLARFPSTPSASRSDSVQVLAYVKELDRPTQRLGRLAVDRVQQQRDRLLAAARAGLDDEPRTAIGGWSSSRIRVV